MIAIIILLIICLILFCVAYFPMQIYDATDNTDIAIVENDISFEDALSHHIAEALGGETDGVLTLQLDGFDVNEILYAIAGEMDFGAVKVRSMYLEQDSDGYKLFVPVRVLGIDSVISGGLSLYESEDVIYAQVEDMKLGRLKTDSGILSFFNIKGLINNLLNKYHINAHFEGETLKASINRSELGLLICEVSKDSPEVELISAVYGILMLDTDAADIEIASPVDMRLTVDLSHFGGVRDESYQAVNSYTAELLKNGVITPHKASLMAKYYLNGFDRLTDEEKTELSEILSKTTAQVDIKSYGGIMERESISLTDILLDQFKINTDTLAPGFKISDENINSLLTDLPFIATVWQFGSYRTADCGYVMLQSLYCKIDDDRIDLYLDLNVNGYLLTLKAGFITGESRSIAIGGTLDSVSFGAHTLGEKNKSSLFGYLCTILKEDWIYTDRETMSLTMDFAGAFNDSPILSAILKGSKNTVTVCKGNLLTDGGFVNIVFSLF